MFSANDIRNAIFSKSMSGYKKEEVDQFLAQVEQDYRQFDKLMAEHEAKIKTLEKEKETFRASSDSIQAVLLNAQKLADQMVTDAETKSGDILQKAQNNIAVMTAQEKELASVFEMKANERKETLEKELTQMIREAKGKAAAIQAAAEDAVHRQQLLYDRLQMEMSAFRSTITTKYKEHLELLKGLPETAPMDPSRMAEVVGEAYDNVPAPETFIQTKPAKVTLEPESKPEEKEKTEQEKEKKEEKKAQEEKEERKALEFKEEEPKETPEEGTAKGFKVTL